MLRKLKKNLLDDRFKVEQRKGFRNGFKTEDVILRLYSEV